MSGISSSNDWWMYHHDEEHSGNASGSSNISSITASKLQLRSIIPLGQIISVPSVVAGKIYVGIGNSIGFQGSPESGGAIFKIDLISGHIENQYTFVTAAAAGAAQGYGGIGCSPAVTGGKVYFSGLDGKIYCLDANTFSPLWITNLRHRDMIHNQPVEHGPQSQATGWSSPLVVNGKVYVGFGEGERGKYGFICCLDANTGNIVWLFCTCQFKDNQDNSQNVIPASLATGVVLPQMFSTQADPLFTGIGAWSSCAYDKTLNRIYIGTANTQQADEHPLPDKKYGSGVLSLDADTGAFKGYFQPLSSDCYRPDDTDVDVAASPLLFTRGNTRILAIGIKSGAFFLLDANTMEVLSRRQLLPKNSNGGPIPTIDVHSPLSNENDSGVFGTAAVHFGTGRIFCGLGATAIDFQTTPFMRAMDWNNLNDAWTTTGNNPPKYVTPVPPMYTAYELGLSSPAIVNDVVFFSTTKPALYAFDVHTGVCVWNAPRIGPSGFSWALGPAIYGNYVIVGTGNDRTKSGNLYIYSL
jgi:outer membrane protein assembly factor BamB